MSYHRAFRSLLGAAGSAFVLALALALLIPAGAAATELRMTNVRVEGGEGNWHAERTFSIDWDQVPARPAAPGAVVYRLYGPDGRLVSGPVRNSVVLFAINGLEVPGGPGVYTLEMWLEDNEGRAGPPAYASLRFDDVAPAPPTPAAPPGWSTSRRPVQLEIGHPAAPLPISGIRGYAITVDQDAGASPCSRPSWCSLSETDLAGGIDDDSIALGPLPEGVGFARVVAVSGSGVASAAAGVPLRIDGTVPQVSLQGVRPGWSNGPVRLTARAGDALSGMAANGRDGPFTAISVDGGAPTLAAGEAASTWITGSGAHQVAGFARDAAGNPSEARGGPDPSTATVLIDEEPPQVLFSAAQDPREPERIEATVTDPLAGPSPERGAIRLRPAGTRRPFELLPTRVVGERLVAHWDSDAYPPGKYEFRATGYDRAGNAATGRTRARGAAMVLVNPLKGRVAMEAAFGGGPGAGPESGALARTVPFGRAVRLEGRLDVPAAAPAAGLEVAVTETFAPGSEPPRRTTLVHTRSDGSFSLQSAPGPTRTIAARFAGTRTLTRAAAPILRLGVAAAVGLRASAATARIGGAPIVFSGRVARSGTSRSADPLPVELQFRYPGSGWSAFRTVEAGADGRFRYAYRFSDDDSRGVRFRFRAFVAGREGWPYEPAFSRPVAVTGR